MKSKFKQKSKRFNGNVYFHLNIVGNGRKEAWNPSVLRTTLARLSNIASSHQTTGLQFIQDGTSGLDMPPAHTHSCCILSDRQLSSQYSVFTESWPSTYINTLFHSFIVYFLWGAVFHFIFMVMHATNVSTEELTKVVQTGEKFTRLNSTGVMMEMSNTVGCQCSGEKISQTQQVAKERQEIVCSVLSYPQPIRPHSVETSQRTGEEKCCTKGNSSERLLELGGFLFSTAPLKSIEAR